MRDAPEDFDPAVKTTRLQVLSRECGMSVGTMRDWLHRSREPRAHSLVKVFEHYASEAVLAKFVRDMNGRGR